MCILAFASAFSPIHRRGRVSGIGISLVEKSEGYIAWVIWTYQTFLLEGRPPRASWSKVSPSEIQPSNSASSKNTLPYELSSATRMRKDHPQFVTSFAQRSLHNEEGDQIRQQIFRKLSICLHTRKGARKTMFNTIWGSFHTILPSIITEA